MELFYLDHKAQTNAFGHVPQALFKIKVNSNDTDQKGAAFQK